MKNLSKLPVNRTAIFVDYDNSKNYLYVIYNEILTILFINPLFYT